MMAKKKKTKKRSARKQATFSPQGWRTSDKDEVERRRQRGIAEPGCLKKINTGLSVTDPFYGDYRVNSDSGGGYDIEIRSLAEAINTCGCPDHTLIIRSIAWAPANTSKRSCISW